MNTLVFSPRAKKGELNEEMLGLDRFVTARFGLLVAVVGILRVTNIRKIGLLRKKVEVQRVKREQQHGKRTESESEFVAFWFLVDQSCLII